MQVPPQLFVQVRVCTPQVLAAEGIRVALGGYCGTWLEEVIWDVKGVVMGAHEWGYT